MLDILAEIKFDLQLFYEINLLYLNEQNYVCNRGVGNKM